MCDYSLKNVGSRPAKIGDELITTDFVGTFTRGFATPEEPSVAICLLPGTELAFKEEVQVDQFLFRLLRWFGKRGGKVARFRQLYMNRPDTHHDALELENGKIVLLTNLQSGQRATVLQLPVRISGGHLSVAQKRGPRLRPLHEPSHSDATADQ